MLRQRILINTIVNSGGKTLVLFLQLFIIAYLVKTIGKEAYGIVVLALALVGNTNLLEAGFGLSVTKYVAEYKAKGDWRSLLEIVNTNFIVSTIIAFVFCAILFFINEFLLDKIFRIPSDLLLPAKGMIRILIILSLAEFWAVSIVRVAEGFQMYSSVRIIEVFKWLLRLAFIMIAVERGYGFLGIGIAYLTAGLINLGVVYYFIFQKISNMKLDISLGNRDSFKMLFGFSVWIFLSKTFAFFSYRIDTIIIGIFLAPVNLAYYNIAFKVYEVLKYGFSLLSSTLVPVTSELEAVRDKRRLALLYEKATKYSVLLMCPVFMLAFYYADWLIRFWVGNGFETSVALTKIFIFSLFGTAVISSGSEMMVGADRVKALIKYNAAATAVNLAFSIYLVQEIGVAGVVVGTLAGSIIIFASYLPVMMKTFDVRTGHFLNNVMLKNALPLLFLFFGLYGITGYFGTIIGIAGYMMISVFFLIDKEDKSEFLAVFTRKGTIGANVNERNQKKA